MIVEVVVLIEIVAELIEILIEVELGYNFDTL